MNWIVLLLFAASLVVLRFLRVKMLVWLAAWWVGTFIVFRYGFTVPIPVSVLKIYMGIITFSLLAYVLADGERIDSVFGPVTAFMTERRFAPHLALVVLALPALAAFQIYGQMTSTPLAPSFGRTVHPAPPEDIDVHGTTYPVSTMDNPFRGLETSDPEAFKLRVEHGREVYYSNCLWCHGDLMAGAGMFAHGLNPIPTSFEDPNTIAALREAFLFWRIAKGAPGLPEEGGPWDSAMPAWENFLSEEEIWDVIIFLYDFTEYRPRAVGLH